MLHCGSVQSTLCFTPYSDEEMHILINDQCNVAHLLGSSMPNKEGGGAERIEDGEIENILLVGGEKSLPRLLAMRIRNSFVFFIQR